MKLLSARHAVKILILAYCFWMVGFSVVTVRAFQTQRDFEQYKDKFEDRQAAQDEKIATNIQRLSDVERRLTTMDAERLAERMTRVEAMSETTHELLIAIASALALLLVETTMRLVSGLRIIKRLEPHS